jgi:4-amino-4-deoxy-L-arabinose transferase-like glycosyltransferase
VAFWQQNQSVEHYPTFTTLQLFQNPWAEFAILHLQVLSGSDRWACLVQWFAMAGSVAAGSLIARELGASALGQPLAAVLVATLPMGILQSTTTQNDYVVAFWIATFVWIALRAAKDVNAATLLCGGAALGLAALSKGTAYLLAAPWVLLAGWHLARGQGWRAAPQALLVAVIALALNAGHYVRNYGLFGHPLGEPERLKELRNAEITPGIVLSNTMRNAALHGGVPHAGLYTKIESGVAWLHGKLGLDVNDSRSTYIPERYAFQLPRQPYSENYQGNPLHLYLAAFTLVVFVATRGWRSHRSPTPYLVCLAASFVLFSLLLRWQPPGSRLQLTVFVLLCPWLASVLGSNLPRWGVAIVGATFLASAVPCVLLASNRPLLGDRSILTRERAALYFLDAAEHRDPLMQVRQYVSERGNKQIGLRGVSSDYLVWVALDARASGIRLEHLPAAAGRTKEAMAGLGTNASFGVEFPRGDFVPDAILAEAAETEACRYAGHEYRRALIAKPYTLFTRTP